MARHCAVLVSLQAHDWAHSIPYSKKSQAEECGEGMEGDIIVTVLNQFQPSQFSGMSGGTVNIAQY